MATWRILKRVDRLDDAPPTFASWLELGELESDSDYYLNGDATRELGSKHGAGDYVLVDVGIKSTAYGVRSNALAVELVGETVYSVREPDDDDDDDDDEAEAELERPAGLTDAELDRMHELEAEQRELTGVGRAGDDVAAERARKVDAELEDLHAQARGELHVVAGEARVDS